MNKKFVNFSTNKQCIIQSFNNSTHDEMNYMAGKQQKTA